MHPTHIAVRALAAFLFLLILLRLSGKRAVAQASPFDFVLALILGELVDKFLTARVEARQFLVAAGTLSLVHGFTSVASHASHAFARFVEGEPVVFQRGGVPIPAALRGERLSGGEVQEMLRHHGLDPTDADEVAEARLETSGHVSVTAQGWAREAQKSDAPRVRALRTRT